MNILVLSEGPLGCIFQFLTIRSVLNLSQLSSKWLKFLACDATFVLSEGDMTKEIKDYIFLSPQNFEKILVIFENIYDISEKHERSITGIINQGKTSEEVSLTVSQMLSQCLPTLMMRVLLNCKAIPSTSDALFCLDESSFNPKFDKFWALYNLLDSDKLPAVLCSILEKGISVLLIPYYQKFSMDTALTKENSRISVLCNCRRLITYLGEIDHYYCHCDCYRDGFEYCDGWI